MKFELVEPVPEPDPVWERGDGDPAESVDATDDSTTSDQDAPRGLQVALDTMTSQVKASGQQIGPSLARLAAALDARQESTADSGQRAQRIPQSFEARRFQSRHEA